MAFDQPRVAVHEGGADDVRACGHRDADREVGIRGPLRGLVQQRLPAAAPRRGRDRQHLDRLAVERDHDVLRFPQSAHAVAVPALAQLDPQLVAGVDREGVAHRGSAARSERQPLDVSGLVEVGRDDERVCHRGADRRADGQPADAPRRGQVALEPAGVEPAEADVVESRARVVRRQERRDVDLQVQQVADRVPVLGRVQAPQRVGAAGIGTGRGGPVELGLQERGQAGVGLAVGARAACRRHHSRPQLAHHLLPDLGVVADARHVDRVEGQPRGAQVVVVAGDAVAVEQGLLGRALPRLPGGDGESRPREDQQGGERQAGATHRRQLHGIGPHVHREPDWAVYHRKRVIAPRLTLGSAGWRRVPA